MRFESRVLQTTTLEAHKSKNMSHNDPCGYFMSHNQELSGYLNAKGDT